MNEFESNDDHLSEYFVNYFVNHYPEFARRWTWTGIQFHEIPMAPSHALNWYEKRLGLNKENNGEQDV